MSTPIRFAVEIELDESASTLLVRNLSRALLQAVSHAADAPETTSISFTRGGSVRFTRGEGP